MCVCDVLMCLSAYVHDCMLLLCMKSGATFPDQISSVGHCVAVLKVVIAVPHALRKFMFNASLLCLLPFIVPHVCVCAGKGVSC